VVYINNHRGRSLTYMLPEIGRLISRSPRDHDPTSWRNGKKDKGKGEEHKGAGIGRGCRPLRYRKKGKDKKENPQRNHLHHSSSPHPQPASYPFPKNFFTPSTPAFPF